MPAIRSALVVTAAVLSIATGTYFAFGDDLTRLIGRQTKMEITPYNDQIAELRAQVDRVSDQFLDNRQAEQQLTALLSAQVDRIGQLEQHTSALIDLFTTGTTKLERIAPPEATPAETKAEPKPRMQLAALAPYARLLDESDQPASKGYIMYANSPTHWTPVPLPDEISSARAPHNNNIRAEIEQAAMLFNVDVRMMKAFARIESGYNPKAKTGKYKCLFQLSDWEFAKYWHGDIYDIRDCSIAAARKFATEAAQFEKDVGRRATAAEIYCIHQQGYQGCAFHYDAPHQLAWKNMYLTGEGQEKGEAWARKAIWGNVPSDLKNKIKGGLAALTSGQFIALWTERVNRFMARKVEPPEHYVQLASKAKKPTKSATTDKKKTKSVAIKKEKMTKLEAR
jgi:hypothetical protein